MAVVLPSDRPAGSRPDSDNSFQRILLRCPVGTEMFVYQTADQRREADALASGLDPQETILFVLQRNLSAMHLKTNLAYPCHGHYIMCMYDGYIN